MRRNNSFQDTGDTWEIPGSKAGEPYHCPRFLGESFQVKGEAREAQAEPGRVSLSRDGRAASPERLIRLEFAQQSTREEKAARRWLPVAAKTPPHIFSLHGCANYQTLGKEPPVGFKVIIPRAHRGQRTVPILISQSEKLHNLWDIR